MKRVSQLFPHQEEGVEFICKTLQANGAALLTDEMGLGKTLQATESLVKLNQWPVLIACPSSCLHVWKADTRFQVDEITQWGPKTQVVLVSYDVLRNAYKYYMERSFDTGNLTNEELIRLCHLYGVSIHRIAHIKGDSLRRELLEMTRRIQVFERIKTIGGSPVYSRLMKQAWSVFVMDEVHAVRNASSLTTKAVGFVNAKYRLGLSGTPIVNAGKDLLCVWKYGLGLFDLDWDSLNSNPNTEYCQGIIERISLGRTKDTVQGLALPKRKKEDENVILEWENDLWHKRVYVQAKQESIQHLNLLERLVQVPGESAEDFRKRRASMQQNFFAHMQRLRQICLFPSMNPVERPPHPCSWTGECVDVISRAIPVKRLVDVYLSIPVITPSPKMIYVYRLLTQEYPGEKMVVFSTYRTFLEHVMGPWLTQIGISHALFCGGSRKEQERVLEEFRGTGGPLGPTGSPRVLLVVKTAGSEGINLSVARICVIMDPHFNQAQDEQAAQRIDRIGQESESVIIRKLFMKGSIDEAMRLMQEEKERDSKTWTVSPAGGGNGGLRSIKSQGLFLRKRDTVE